MDELLQQSVDDVPRVMAGIGDPIGREGEPVVVHLRPSSDTQSFADQLDLPLSDAVLVERGQVTGFGAPTEPNESGDVGHDVGTHFRQRWEVAQTLCDFQKDSQPEPGRGRSRRLEDKIQLLAREGVGLLQFPGTQVRLDAWVRRFVDLRHREEAS